MLPSLPSAYRYNCSNAALFGVPSLSLNQPGRSNTSLAYVLLSVNALNWKAEVTSLLFHHSITW